MGRLVRKALNEDVLLAEWSRGDEESYEQAAAVLDRELEEGNTAARVDGWKHESVTKLPPDADLVVVTTAMGGG